MKPLAHHLHHLRSKPHHVRHRIAIGTAAGVTGVIGMVWLVGSVSTGVFALKDNSFADAVRDPAVVVPAGVPSGGAGLAGAAAAPAVSDKNAPAHIEIVNVTPPPAPKAEQTTIPF